MAKRTITFEEVGRALLDREWKDTKETAYEISQRVKPETALRCIAAVIVQHLAELPKLRRRVEEQQRELKRLTTQVAKLVKTLNDQEPQYT